MKENAKFLKCPICDNIIEIIDAFLKTPFSYEERHQRRVKEIEEYESKVMK